MHIPVIAAECLTPMFNFLTLSLSNASIFYGTPLGIYSCYLISVALGPSLGIEVHKYTEVLNDFRDR